MPQGVFQPHLHPLTLPILKVIPLTVSGRSVFLYILQTFKPFCLCSWSSLCLYAPSSTSLWLSHMSSQAQLRGQLFCIFHGAILSQEESFYRLCSRRILYVYYLSPYIRFIHYFIEPFFLFYLFTCELKNTNYFLFMSC